MPRFVQEMGFFDLVVLIVIVGAVLVWIIRAARGE